MPRSRRLKKPMFRDFLYKNKEIRETNKLKNIRKIRRKVTKEKELTIAQFEFLFWGYDLEFFTLDFASSNFDMNKKNLYDQVVHPLMRRGYMYKYFDKLTPSNTYEDHLFREETKYNYRVRYALSQKAVNSVISWYRELG